MPDLNFTWTSLENNFVTIGKTSKGQFFLAVGFLWNVNCFQFLKSIKWKLNRVLQKQQTADALENVTGARYVLRRFNNSWLRYNNNSISFLARILN